MKVELEHHYGWEVYNIKGEEVLKNAAYRAVLRAHDFLTPENHKWKWIKAEMDESYAYIEIIKNEKSPIFSMAPNWVDDGPGATWFTVHYRRPEKKKK